MPAKNLLSPRVLPGLVVAAAGVILLLNSFDILDLVGLARFWPLLLVSFGAHLAIEGGNRVFGSILAAVGVALQLDNLGMLTINIRDVMRLWPVVLIALGAQMLIQPKGKYNSVVGIILLSLGSYFLASNFGLIDFGLQQLWPIAVVAAGVGMLRKALASA
ncbi:MAG: DUF5668 domain-containing protein [Acidobacteria bacterium]|nr:DUF5668 domain-containing protein [Acidobacteriota bacterium]MDA1235657.1 DUF5668 domain-containing protein [Acidobacteriota bacterium]